MKVLMTTEKIDVKDTIFAFAHLWAKTIAENKDVENLTVVALSVGEYDLPKNTKVLSLGKEKYDKNNKFLKKIKYLLNFYKYIWTERNNYTHVFVHMNQQNVILGSIIWKLLGKRVGLWYTHRQVSTSLKLAVKLADVVFTAAEESMNVPTKKKRVLGHGILTESFKNANRKEVFEFNTSSAQKKIVITSVGRITQIKNLETLIRAAKLLKQKNIFAEVRLIGPEVNDSDKKYRAELDKLVAELELGENVKFLGGKKVDELKQELWNADIHVNLCPLGGLDKAVIEAACSGLHSFVANQAFKPHYGNLDDTYMFEFGNPQDLANKIGMLVNESMENTSEKLTQLQNSMVQKFDIENLIKKLLLELRNS